MDKLIINGPCKLSGEVEISSAKNASLPILFASLLVPGKTVFTKLPDLMDIGSTKLLLSELGAKLNDETDLTIDASGVNNFTAPYDIVRKMRASILVLGPLLARFKKAEVSLPGGCAIGTRPIDIHLEGFEQMGAQIIIEKGFVKAKCDKLKGAKIKLKFPSVGATENLIMGAVLAEGETILSNAAREPEIDDLINFLNQRGAKIEGIGTSTIKIQGVGNLTPVQSPYQIIPDRIEALTYIVAAIMTNSSVKVTNCIPAHFESVIQLLKLRGANLEVGENFVQVEPTQELTPIKCETQPYPGIPTDVQAQLMALSLVIPGESHIVEAIFENRFMHVPELTRMGAEIELDGSHARINQSKMIGAPVMCTDLRASAALILAALVADGETEINRIYHLDRGYEKLAQKFEKLGANIKRVKA